LVHRYAHRSVTSRSANRKCPTQVVSAKEVKFWVIGARIVTTTILTNKFTLEITEDLSSTHTHFVKSV